MSWPWSQPEPAGGVFSARSSTISSDGFADGPLPVVAEAGEGGAFVGEGESTGVVHDGPEPVRIEGRGDVGRRASLRAVAGHEEDHPGKAARSSASCAG